MCRNSGEDLGIESGFYPEDEFISQTWLFTPDQSKI